jgi:hypothetical protein
MESAAAETAAIEHVATSAPMRTPEPVDYASYAPAKEDALTALKGALNESCSCLYVYRDFGATENHFTQKAKMFGGNGELVKNMDENWKSDPYAGRSCIRCEIGTEGKDWGGWMFLNGYLPAGETVPRLNDGKQKSAGIDLTGATELRFFAKGESGGETVEFFTAGFGYDGEWGNKLVDYPDSARSRRLALLC